MHIIQYQKITDEYTTHEVALQSVDGELQGVELCEIDGLTYVAVPEVSSLPAQPEKIAIADAVLTTELRAKIKAASPHCKLIKQRNLKAIESSYSLEDRLQIAAIAGGVSNSLVPPSAEYTEMMEQYRDHVLAANTASAKQYAALGL